MKKILLGLITAAAFILTSCTAEITITNNGDGADISFNGAAEKGFENLIQSMGAENQDFIDTNQVSDELCQSGFKNVKVTKNEKSEGKKPALDLSIFLNAPNTSNFLFSSKVIRMEDKLWIADFSKENLKAFYASADPQITQFLDLLLAPVFNDEEMSVQEYLEIVAALYGDAVAEELKSSSVKVVSKGSRTRTETYSLPEILCGLAASR